MQGSIPNAADRQNGSANPNETFDPQASTIGSNGSAENTIDTGSLRVGRSLSQNIYDESGVLLLVAGSEVTPRFLELLRQRGDQSVTLRPPWPPPQPPNPGEPASVRKLDDQLAAELNKHDPIGAAPAPQPIRLPFEALQAEAKQGLQRHVDATAVLAGICETSQSGRAISSDKMRGLLGEFVGMLTLDSDLLATIVSMQATLGEYLFDHCVNSALLSMTVASQLGLNRERILAVGFGAVFQDVGMLRVPEAIRLAPRDLTPEEREEVERHPVRTLHYLEQIRGLPVEAGFIGYHAHERADGAGYPRQRSSTTIHPLAKIVAVADVYAAMTRPRPYRPQIAPHEAMKQILADTGRGRFDRTVVRALLDSVSAFPIGTIVELRKGIKGRVIRANPGHHTRPVIAVIDADGTPTDWIIDLSQETGLEVLKAHGPAQTKEQPTATLQPAGA